MFRIRFHGRGGQGMKTASRILGSAFFLAGYEVQDAPRYGAERRGAPIFAYVRADKAPINERGIITRPDLVVVADDTLVAVPAAGVMAGLDAHTILLIDSHDAADVWRQRLNLQGSIVSLPAFEEDRAEQCYVSTACAAAAARLVGVISPSVLEQAIEQELGHLGGTVLEKNQQVARQAYAQMAGAGAKVTESPAQPLHEWQAPDWIELEFEQARIAAPIIHGPDTSEGVKTGLWRTMRPVIDYEHCKGCWWVCSTFCPDSAIKVEKGLPQIDYDHCKGCLVCVAQCPSHAIEAIPEHLAEEKKG